MNLSKLRALSTDLNGYAGLWTDAVMQTLQTSILEVIQHRCESQPPTSSGLQARFPSREQRPRL